MKHFLCACFLIFLFHFESASLLAQDSFNEEAISLKTDSVTIYGTLTLPTGYDETTPVALIITGSGPTDRDGNNPIMTNNSLQMLAHQLAENKIASLRYDKRGIGESTQAMQQEDALRFEDYVNDASRWVDKINATYDLGPLTIIGHSEGSLIGMLATQQSDVSKFISVAGPAQSADEIIRQQLSDQHQAIKEPSYAILDSLEAGKRVQNVPSMLDALFRPSVQPYLLSWFKYEPQEVIEELDVPVLIVQGTTDFQVSVAQAQMLAKSAPEARLLIVQGMNHILKKAPVEKMPNAATYNQPRLPLVDEAVNGIVSFILAP